jgi:small subunit ribosomal protein S1
VRVSVDRERKRISLSIRQLQPDPGQKVGHWRSWLKLSLLTKFGAFARLDDELEGLIHVSELSENRINHPKEAVKEGDVVTLRVIKIDPERRRIGLSLRKVDSPAYADLDWKMALSDEVGDSQAVAASDEVEEVEEASEPQAVAAVSEEVEEVEEVSEPQAAAAAPEEVEEAEETSEPQAAAAASKEVEEAEEASDSKAAPEEEN